MISLKDARVTLQKVLPKILGYLFPPFYKKVTWMVLYLGAGIVADSYLLEGLLKWLFQVGVAYFTGGQLPVWSDVDQDGSLGVWLIGLALLYSLGFALVEAVEIGQGAMKAEENRRIARKRDKKLYSELLTYFGSGTKLAEFITTHDFGHSWGQSSSDYLDDFCSHWDVPERAFITESIQTSWQPILRDMKSLNTHLSYAAAPLRANGAIHGIHDPSLHDEMNPPANVIADIRKANDISVHIRECHRHFIYEAEKFFAEVE